VTEQELASRALAYVNQAADLLRRAGPLLTARDEGTAMLVSLRANLESAQLDLAALGKLLAP